MIVRMFEQRSASAEDIARLDDLFERNYPSKIPESEALVERICSASRAANHATAERLVAVGELFALRLRRCSETEDWAADTMEAVAAEVAAALQISQGLARSYLGYARAMRERLPRVAEVFKRGDIDYRLFQIIVFRTDLITDGEVLAAVDAELAVTVPRWSSMTLGRLGGQIDKIVAKVDIDAVRRRKERQEERGIEIWDLDSGLSEIHGSTHTPDAHALDKRLNALAATVCEHDPRTLRERRADALGALACGANRLGCRCGRPDCAAGKKPPAGPVQIHVIAEQATMDGTGSEPGSMVAADAVIPAELVEQLAKSTKPVPLVHPADSPPESGYAPSKALANFVRCRDLTCRFPGCDKPASDCDIDHTIPFADGGPTHASNLKCYCRIHHLVKTFWGWQDQQLPDGTVILVSPSGRTYVTTPGSALLFPSLCQPTGDLEPAPITRLDDCPLGSGSAQIGQRTAMMPKRSRTRAQERAHKIAAERRQNRDARFARSGARPTYFRNAPPETDDEPTPF